MLGRAHAMQEHADATRVLSTAQAVVRYLVARPGAKDTLDGIARWWLERERTDRLLVEVEQAVDLLLSEGIVLETRGHGIPSYYRLNAERRESIARLLMDPGRPR